MTCFASRYFITSQHLPPLFIVSHHFVVVHAFTPYSTNKLNKIYRHHLHPIHYYYSVGGSGLLVEVVGWLSWNQHQTAHDMTWQTLIEQFIFGIAWWIFWCSSFHIRHVCSYKFRNTWNKYQYSSLQNPRNETKNDYTTWLWTWAAIYLNSSFS